MSNPIPLDIDIDSATVYNEYKAQYIGWYENIPEHATREHPCWSHDAVNGSDAEKERFAIETLSFQREFSRSPADHDGKFGPRTWLEVQKRFSHVDNAASFILVGGLRREIPSGRLTCPLTTFETEFDLHPAGKFGTRRTGDSVSSPRHNFGIRCLVLHWGGTTLPGLYRYLRHTDRSVSTHFGVDRDRACQFLDLKHRAWHAGHVNDFTVGIDICQQPLPEYYEYYDDAGACVEVVSNPSTRGQDKILTLDPETAKNTRNLVFALGGALNLKLRAPETHDVVPDLEDSSITIVGHHHVKRTKWDVACWWRQIFHDTVLDISY